MNKISVIVPVYNGEKYLRRTLEDLLSQSLTDLEIICVNDKSSDGSLDILKEYQKQDKRIKIIDCPFNGGESKARNIGLKSASGEYVAFMDQDDSVDPFFYEKIYEKAKETSSDIAKGNSIEIDYEGEKIKAHKYPVEKNPLYFCNNWWTGIYKRDFLIENKLELLENVPLGGDLKFLFDASSKANKICSVDDVFYYHIMHQDSGDSLITPLHKIKSVVEVLSYILDSIEEKNVFEIDKDLYLTYYVSYIYHAYVRIEKCREKEGKLLCSNFIFKYFNNSKCKDLILRKLNDNNQLLVDCLRNNDKDFFDKIISEDVLSGVYYPRNKMDEKLNESVIITVPFIDEEVNRYVKENPFINDENVSLNLIDNRAKNENISVLYNRVLDNYDFAKESWFIFMHSDFELLDSLSFLNHLDKSKIYGPCGTKTIFVNEKVGFLTKGKVLEKDSFNTMYNNVPYKFNDLSVDTLDCMCVIIHSSLIQKYNLRFDENCKFDLYVEDFCISAKKEHDIDSVALYIDCAHHSSYVLEQNISERYLDMLNYVNSKYPNDIFGGTVTPIGGKILPTMNKDELRMYKVRYKIKTGRDL